MNDYGGLERRSENNDYHRQQHDLTTAFMARMTEATEHIGKSLDKNWEQHNQMLSDIGEVKNKEAFHAGKWAGFALAVGVSVTIIGILLKGLSVLKYALGQ